MLTDNSFNSVASIVESLGDTALIPVNNTYLFELFKASLDNLTMDYAPSITNGEIGRETEHDLLQDKIIDILTKSIASQLSFVRSEVIPTVDLIYDEVKKSLDSYTNKDFTSTIEIIQQEIPEYLSTPEFSQELDKYGPNDKPILPIGASTRYSDELIDRVRLAASEYYDQNTSAASDYINQITNDRISHALQFLTFPISSIKTHDIINEALDRYFINETLRNNEELALDVVDSPSLNNLRDVLKSVRAYVLPLLSANKKLADNISNEKYGILVLSLDNTNNKIYVNAPIYNKFLNEGYSNNILFGLLADPSSSPTDYSYNSIVNNKDKLIAYFDEFIKLARINNELNYFNEFRSFFKIFFYNHNVDKADFEKEYESINPGYAQTVKTNLEKELEKVKLPNIKDDRSLYNTIMKLVTKSRYFYTDAYKILTYMNNEANESTDPSTAATIATIFYLVDYFFDQMRII